MPYKPGSLDESDRSLAYRLMWLGLPDSLVLFLAVLAGYQTIATVTAGFAAGTMLVAFNAADEFVERQVSVAARWAASAAGVCLILVTFPGFRDYSWDPALMLAGIAVIFQVTLAWQRLKDR